MSSFSKRASRGHTRVYKREQALKEQLPLLTDRKHGFTFRGLKYEICRLKNGEYIVMHGARLVRNPHEKLLDKAKRWFANLDAFEVMDS